MKKRIFVVLSVFLVVGGLIGYHYFRKYSDRRAQATAAEARSALETEIKAHQLINDLKAPPEAVYITWEAQREINKIRRYGFERLGLHRFIPYSAQVYGGRRGRIEWSPDEEFRDIEDYDTSTSVESTWGTLSFQASGSLAFAFRNKGSRLYEYFKQRPHLYEKEIRPRLLLLVDDENWMRSMSAYDALVAGGERSDFLRHRLNARAMDPSGPSYSRALRLLKECGYEAPEPWPTVESLPAYKDDTQSAKDAQGQPLPPGALHRIRRNPVLLGNSPDGHTIYLPKAPPPPVKSADRYPCHIQSFDLDSGKRTTITFDGPDKADIKTVSDDGKMLATYGYIPNPAPDPNKRWDKHLYRLMLWDLQTGRPIGPITSHYAIKWLRFSPDKSRLIVGEKSKDSGEGCTSVYDVSSRKLLYRFPLTLKSPPKLRLDQIDDLGRKKEPAEMEMLGFVKGDRIQALKVWAERNDMRAVDFNPTIHVYAAALSHSGRFVAAFSCGRVRFWNIRERRKEKRHSRPKFDSTRRLQIAHADINHSHFMSAAYSPGDEFLLTTGYGSGSIVVWNRNGKPLGKITGHEKRVSEIRCIGNKLVSRSWDGTLLVWDWPRIANQFRPKAVPKTVPKAVPNQIDRF